MNTIAFRRLAAVHLRQHDINNDAWSVTNEHFDVWSAFSRGPSRQDSDETSSLGKNSSVSREIISPPPAVLSAQSRHYGQLRLKTEAVVRAKPTIIIETTSGPSYS